MAQSELTERERQVFISIVKKFIETAEPVGSRYLSKHADLNISPATIRNVMVDLEEKGYIWQPHASAGRVPTNAGYRIYVDELMSQAKLSSAAKKAIWEQLKSVSQDVDLLIEKASHILSNISCQLGVVLAPRFNQGRLHKIDLVQITDNTILLVISIKGGLVKTVIVEVDQNVPYHLLEMTKQLLNERLHDLTIEEVQRTFELRFSDLDEKSRNLLKTIKNKTEKLMKLEGPVDFHISGMGKVIQQPEFASQEKMEVILDLIDRRDLLLKVLHETEGEGVSIVIGEENKEDIMKNCSVITTMYHCEGVSGTIGVIGPTRMQYDKIISLVKFMAETLGCLLSKK